MDAHVCPCGRTFESRTHVVWRMRNIQGGTGCVRRGDEEIGRMRHGGVW